MLSSAVLRLKLPAPFTGLKPAKRAAAVVASFTLSVITTLRLPTTSTAIMNVLRSLGPWVPSSKKSGCWESMASATLAKMGPM